MRLLLDGGTQSGRQLIIAGAGVWLTNVIIFGLVLWETDQGGPHARSTGRSDSLDLLFPQLTVDLPQVAGWSPSFVDYLYVSFTNSTAFSPTDTMPLTSRAKLIMLTQALLSFVTVGLVIARAVNILSYWRPHALPATARHRPLHRPPSAPPSAAPTAARPPRFGRHLRGHGTEDVAQSGLEDARGLGRRRGCAQAERAVRARGPGAWSGRAGRQNCRPKSVWAPRTVDLRLLPDAAASP